MLVWSDSKELHVVFQTDHANLSAQLAAEWGNSQFDKPEPFGEVLLGTVAHDDGWMFKDYRPLLDSRGRPADLSDYPTGEFLGIHKDTIELANKAPPYSRLLVSMHRTGLCQQRYGTDKGWDVAIIEKLKDSLTPETKNFVVEEERHQKKIRAQLDNEFTSAVRVWANYKLLQIWDRMSLFLCYLSPSGAKDEFLFPTPSRYAGDETRLHVGHSGKMRVSVDPWPFGRNRMTVSVRAYRIPDKEYSSTYGVSEQLYKTTPEILTFELSTAK